MFRPKYCLLAKPCSKAFISLAFFLINAFNKEDFVYVVILTF